ncbi:uncharacterized protein HMPREF1541_08057 [Cyphellophora europaea CBS 101466]|uniref:Uncharacterized protein n=1 Tax=Cyphellophora europaea (strain CBS 101466) TaxID=1220924 RepID=W2RKP9_CYPE1|nr:uncharacterized protein HMPREF1541_08057 [Cyphellophora europaea CBS 101466]ETN37067.1 hypothetical protein HMPREF1541_08057 [Cyphellophora europaea CBS 101466]
MDAIRACITIPFQVTSWTVKVVVLQGKLVELVLCLQARPIRKVTEHIDAVEGCNYPVYDADDRHHNPSPTRSSKASSRPGTPSEKSQLQKYTSKSSLNTPKNFLDSMAARMKAVSELFHKDTTASQTSEESHRTKSSSTRSLSPKKSVRFKSATFSRESTATSSPINVPTKTTPSLPALRLSTEGFPQNLTMDSLRDPIPTGRPQDTPILKSQAANDYFFPFPTEIDSQLDTLKGRRESSKPLPLIDLEKRASEQDNPFADPDDVSGSPSRIVSSQAVGPLDSDRGSCRSNTSSTPPVRMSTEEEWSRLSPSKPPDDAGQHVRIESESNITNPFLESTDTFEIPQVPPGTPEDTQSTENNEVLDNEDRAKTANPPSAWSLESRVVDDAGVKRNTTKPDTDSDDSDDTIALLRRRPVPTHEDIRRQFRSRRLQEQAQSATGLESQISQAMQENVTPSMQTDPTEYFAEGKRSQPSASVSPEVGFVPDNAVSPLNLRSNISSVSPGRSRRPFRFSNRTPDSSPSVGIGTTQFGWEGHKLAAPVYGPKRLFEGKTPSPTSVLLPPSVASKTSNLAKWYDQYAWTPFDEAAFSKAFLDATQDLDLRDILTQHGGFAQVWRILDLPRGTSPADDTRGLKDVDVQELVMTCRMIAQPESPKPVEERSDYLGPTADKNSHAFASATKDARKYSGEVSTIADSTQAVESASSSRLRLAPSGQQVTTSDVVTSSESGHTATSCSLCRSQHSCCRCTESSWTSTEYHDSKSQANSLSEDESDVEVIHAASKLGSSYPNESTSGPDGYPGVETTPKQDDYVRKNFYWPIRERSVATTESSGDLSDDERYTQGII